MTGHSGSKGSTFDRRQRRYAKSVMMPQGENLAYSDSPVGELYVMQLFVDDGVKSRGHRTNILYEDYWVVGVGSSDYIPTAGNYDFGRTVCIVYAGGFEDDEALVAKRIEDG